MGPDYRLRATPPEPPAHEPAPRRARRTPLSSTLTGLTPYTTYHYRVVATNGGGHQLRRGSDLHDDARGSHRPGARSATDVHSDRAVLHAQVNPNGADTTVHFEYVDDADFQQSGWADATETSPEIGVGMSKHFQSASHAGQRPHARHPLPLPRRRHQRRPAAASADGAPSRTFAFTPSFNDPCPNAHVRQQTGAALLLDCRAYELVSAANAGGYDVESNLVAGPDALRRLPRTPRTPPGSSTASTTAASPAPATRPTTASTPTSPPAAKTAGRTEYVGIPANDPFAAAPFASTLAEADAGLDTFAFGGPDICSPCFADGSTGIPVHLPERRTRPGHGGLDHPGPPPNPPASSASASPPTAPTSSSAPPRSSSPTATNGEISIYDRNLSTDDNPRRLQDARRRNDDRRRHGNRRARHLHGRLADRDRPARRPKSAAPSYWHLYMNVGDSGQTIDLTPGTTDGVLYDGMTADGSKVFFTTTDALTGDDDTTTAPTSTRPTSTTPATPTLTRISTGTEGTGNTDACDPAANTSHTALEHDRPRTQDCDVVAVGGGGGVASGDGTIYFLSPGAARRLRQRRPGRPQPLPRPARLGAALRRHPGVERQRAAAARRTSASCAPSAPSPTPPASRSTTPSGDVYVLDIDDTSGNGVVDKFDSSGNLVTSFGNTAARLDGVPGAATGPSIGHRLPTASRSTTTRRVQSNGDLYVPDISATASSTSSTPSGNHIARSTSAASPPASRSIRPTATSTSPAFGIGVTVFDAGGNPITELPDDPSCRPASPSTRAATSTSSTAVATSAAQGTDRDLRLRRATTSDSSTANPSKGVAVDPSDDHVYVDEGNRVVEFDSSGNPVGAPIGSGLLSELDRPRRRLRQRSYVSNSGVGQRRRLRPAGDPRRPPHRQPARHRQRQRAGTRHTADFQVNPDRRRRRLHLDPAADRLRQRRPPRGLPLRRAERRPRLRLLQPDRRAGDRRRDASPPTASSLTDDGRVFFNSDRRPGRPRPERQARTSMSGSRRTGTEPSLRSAGGCIELISTGTSPFDSSLLGVSADGTDAYFFTRDTLVAAGRKRQPREDLRRPRRRRLPLSSRRRSPARPPTSATAPARQAPPPPDDQQRSPAPRSATRTAAKACKAGFVKKHGKCVKQSTTRRKRHHQSGQASHG